MSGAAVMALFDLDQAERDALDVCIWIKRNWADFRKLMAVFHHQVDIGCPNTKQGELEYLVQRMGVTLDVGGEFRHNRNLYPGLTRYMVMLSPRLARTIGFRRSRLDDVDLVGIWHATVNPGTTFLADSWQVAKHLVDIDDASAR